MQRDNAQRREPARLVWLLKTALWWVLLALGLVLLVEQLFPVSQVATDFCQDYIAASRLARGLPVYLPLHLWPGYSACPMPLEYDAHPPPSVLFFLPFALFPKVPALWLWGLLSLLAYLSSGWLLLRRLGWLSLGGVALFVFGSIFWAPLVGAEEAQNLAQMLTFLLVAAWLLEEKKRDGWAGALIGLAALLKVWPVIFLLGAAAQRRWKIVLVGSIVVLAGAALAAGVLGAASYATYLGPVQREERLWVPTEGNISLVGAVVRLFLGIPLLLPPLIPGVSQSAALLLSESLAGLLIASVVAWLCWLYRAPQPEPIRLLSWGLLVTLLLLTFPLTWHWGLITLLLPGATLLLALRTLPRPPRWWRIALAVSLLPLLLPQSWLLQVTGWLIARQSAGLLWLEVLLLALPTFGLLLLTILQAWLLWQARAQPLCAILTEDAPSDALSLVREVGQRAAATETHTHRGNSR